jgi:uncharacterized protein (TIGR02598 family)
MSKKGFSLVEVALALGIIAFALLTILALVPMGIASVHISAEEMRATDILSILTTDLRNTGTPATGSQIFGLSLPYARNTSGRSIFSTSLAQASSTTLVSALATAKCTTGVNESESPVSLSSGSLPIFQASIVYLSIPVNAAPIQARLIVNWPPLTGSTATVADLTSVGKVQGYVEALVTYPAP